MRNKKTRVSPRRRGSRELLDQQRQEMRNITKAIINLVHARQELSSGIADVKRSLGEQIYNEQVESKLVSDIGEYAQRIGLDEKIARAVVQDLIEYSKLAQREKISRVNVRSYLRANKVKTIGIVGAGRMGTWFANYFKIIGAKVMLYDENRLRAKSRAREIQCESVNGLEDLASSDMVIIAVPISKIPESVRDLTKTLRNKIDRRKHTTRIFEISSVKSRMAGEGFFQRRSARERSQARIELYSIHPLFGPDAPMFAEKTMIQVYPSHANFVRGLFPHFQVMELNWKSHDKLMSVLLSLPHAVALAFADSVSAYKIPNHVSTPSFDRLLDLSNRVLKENPDVYFEIQKLNPYSKHSLLEMSRSLERLQKSVDKKSEFRRFFVRPKMPTAGIDGERTDAK
jgi:prephenate dehydrogenase/chorismate mutase